MTDTSTTQPANALDQRAAELTKTTSGGFLALLAEATHSVAGRRIVQPEDLRGVPFIITGARFQPGKGGDFVSLECTAADKRTLQIAVGQKRTFIQSVDLLPVVGDEEFVINDGSTGIRRQVVEWLDSVGLITINRDWDFKAAEKTSVFDQPILNKREEPVWLAGVEAALAGFADLRFLAPRGTRISEYTYQGDTAMTCYLA